MHAARSVVVLALMLTAVNANAQTRNRQRSRVDVELYARLLSMTDSRSFDLALVNDALASSWPPLRAAATLAIGQVGASHGIPGAPRLRELLNDRDVVVASNAAYALGLLRDSASIPALSAALGGAPRVAREAAWALGEIGAPARDAITSRLSVPSTDNSRTIQLLLAAAKLRPVPIKEISQYLTPNTDNAVLWAAAYAVARPYAASGVRKLVQLGQLYATAPATKRREPVRDNPPAVIPTADAYDVSPAEASSRLRQQIARGLAKNAAGDSLADQAFPILRGLALDSDPHVRINAVRSLATYGPRARTLVVTLARDADANTRIAAAQSLGTVLDSVVASWTPLWSYDTSLVYRSSLLASALRAGAMIPQFVEWQGAPDWRYRASAMGAAIGAANKRLAAQLGSEMRADKDARVRVVAYTGLSGADSLLTPATRAALVQGLNDPDFIVRSVVVGGFARRPAATDVPIILNMYERSQRDSLNDARQAAIAYVAAAWKRDSLNFTPELRERIRRMRPSDDPLVRAEASGITPFSGWQSTSGTPKPLEWYQSIVRTYVLPSLSGNRPRATIRTNRGNIVLDLFGADAPITVDNFLRLARSGYYRNTHFHRVVPNFVIQDGDPRDDGSGGPGYAIRDEMNPRRYDRGALGMALSGPDTGGSQYFITHSPQPHLDGHYTVFGRVLRGFSALDSIVQGDPILAVTTK